MMNLMINKYIQLVIAFVSMASLTACQQTPPADRPAVTAEVYTKADALKGKQLYQQECENCHKLQLGSNEKGPQLMRIYQAKAGLLTDYRYTEALLNSQLIWTAENLDKYIADPKNMMAGTRMRSDPITNPQDRQDIIAYLSTLR